MPLGATLAVPVCDALRVDGTWLDVKEKVGVLEGVDVAVKLAFDGGTASRAMQGCVAPSEIKLQNGPPGFEAHEGPAAVS